MSQPDPKLLNILQATLGKNNRDWLTSVLQEQGKADAMSFVVSRWTLEDRKRAQVELDKGRENCLESAFHSSDYCQFLHIFRAGETDRKTKSHIKFVKQVFER